MPDRTLILLRHAKSDWAGGGPDIDRPLAARGIRQAPEAGRWLAENIAVIDLAVLSPAHRARSTWELASAEIIPSPPSRIVEEIYAASVHDLLTVVRALPDDLSTVILIGHNPGIEDLASLLTDESVSMPTAALAVIGLEGSWTAADESSGRLRASGRPPKPSAAAS